MNGSTVILTKLVANAQRAEPGMSNTNVEIKKRKDK